MRVCKWWQKFHFFWWTIPFKECVKRKRGLKEWDKDRDKEMEMLVMTIDVHGWMWRTNRRTERWMHPGFSALLCCSFFSFLWSLMKKKANGCSLDASTPPPPHFLSSTPLYPTFFYPYRFPFCTLSFPSLSTVNSEIAYNLLHEYCKNNWQIVFLSLHQLIWTINLTTFGWISAEYKKKSF